MWKNASSDDKFVEGTKVSKLLSGLFNFAKTLLSHNCLNTCIVISHLSVKISEQQYQVFSGYSFDDTLQPLMEVSLCFIMGFAYLCVALNKDGFPNLSMKPCLTILDDTGFQPMSDFTACGISINPTPFVWGAFASS